MNLYIRYFDIETLVTNVDDAIGFLSSIEDIEMNDRIAKDVREYFESTNHFPKRYKVRPKIYFIMIKTDANTMQEFKEYRQRSVTEANNEADTLTNAAPADTTPAEPLGNQSNDTYDDGRVYPMPDNGMGYDYQDAPMQRYDRRALREARTISLYTELFGWYEGVFDFKRVVTNPNTGKNEYRDTHFVVRCKAISGMDCYNRIIDYLQSCVDSRSQFPSPKGRNFSYEYLGACKPLPEEMVDYND